MGDGRVCGGGVGTSCVGVGCTLGVGDTGTLEGAALVGSCRGCSGGVGTSGGGNGGDRVGCFLGERRETRGVFAMGGGNF